MKYIIGVLLFAGLILIFTACEKTIFLELSDNEQKIVMNGLLTPDYGLWLNLSKSVSCSEPSVTSFKPINSAIVEYYQNDELIASLISSTDIGDYYETDFKPKHGNEYLLTVDTYGMPEASAVVTVPYPVEITGFDTTILNNILYNEYGYYTETEFFVTIRFRDPVTIQNYYMLGLFYLESGHYQPLEAYTEDINMNIHIQDGLNILVWNDKNFNGQAFEFMINYKMVEDRGFETEFRIILYSIEEEYFKYLKSYSQNFTILNEDVLLFEPVQVSSNVTGGYGIVAAFSSNSVSFKYTF